MSNLAETLRALGDLRGALELHKQTLTARQGVLGPDDPDTPGPRQQPRSSPLGLGEL
jgi:hypothetical protein